MDEQPEPEVQRDEPQRILVKATVNLPDGFKVGTVRWVNPNAEWISAALAATLLVPVEENLLDV